MKMKQKLAKFRMTVDVDLFPNGTCSTHMKTQLANSIQHLVENGLLTGTTASCLHRSRVSVKTRT